MVSTIEHAWLNFTGKQKLLDDPGSYPGRSRVYETPPTPTPTPAYPQNELYCREDKYSQLLKIALHQSAPFKALFFFKNVFYGMVDL